VSEEHSRPLYSIQFSFRIPPLADHLDLLRSSTNMARLVAALSLAVVALASSSSTLHVEAALPVPKGVWPTSTGSVTNSSAIVVRAGTVFDGKMKTYQRSDIKCTGQSEGGAADAMFIVEAGATLKNVIIGANQREGVHCDKHGCTIENVWWNDVCEDALTIKGGSASSVTKVLGGGARNAEDKVIQHNGLGTVQIEGFYAQDFGKLYRSCGTCGLGKQRNVVLTNVYALNPKVSVVTVNQNNQDTAKFNNVYVKSVKGDKVKVCAWSQAVSSGEPVELGSGPKNPLCQYSTSTVHFTAP
jgi:pectate lyase